MVNADGVQKLTERQKEILRLLLNGHDVKSAAIQLGISVHTVNEHLREARRHLGVANSRPAARVLGEVESSPPKFMRPKTLGVDRPGGKGPWLRTATPNRRVVYAGVALVVLVAAVIAFSTGEEGAPTEALDAFPKVVATKPYSGDAIAPGQFDLAVTFDRPMLDGNYSFVQVAPETYPRCEARPQLSVDRRSFTLRCTAEAGRTYEVWFNRSPYLNFKSLSGTPAQPYQLKFRARIR